jgi:hypothetical protein
LARLHHKIVYDGGELRRENARTKNAVIRIPESPWSDLIYHLSEERGGNVHEKGLVDITCSSRD